MPPSRLELRCRSSIPTTAYSKCICRLEKNRSFVPGRTLTRSRSKRPFVEPEHSARQRSDREVAEKWETQCAEALDFALRPNDDGKSIAERKLGKSVGENNSLMKSKSRATIASTSLPPPPYYTSFSIPTPVFRVFSTV